MKKNGLRIDANYTEDVVGFALESFLTLLGFPRQRFTIEPFSRAEERWLGADARFEPHRVCRRLEFNSYAARALVSRVA